MKNYILKPKDDSGIAADNQWPFRGLALLAVLLCVGMSLVKANAQSLASTDLAWACWVGDEEPINIICVHDRAQLYHVLPANPEDELKAAVLDQIYERILGEQTAGLEAFAREHSGELSTGDIWFIRIWSPPTKESWKERTPQRLVAAGLCQKGIPCRVILREPEPSREPEPFQGPGPSQGPVPFQAPLPSQGPPPWPTL